MSSIPPSTHGPVRVSWKPNGEVELIEYDSAPLLDVTNQLAMQLVLTSAGDILFPAKLTELLSNILDAAIESSNSPRQQVYVADKLFEHLDVRFNPPNPTLSAAYWRAVLAQVWSWEDRNQPIHKGTAYYILGARYLALGDIPSAYISLFNALEEDRRNYGSLRASIKNSPVYKTTSLVDDSNNALHQSVVIPLRDDLSRYLKSFLSLRSSSLNMTGIDSKFLQNDALEDIKRFFVANLHEIHHLTPINSTRMMNNDYSRTKVIDTLFNLGLIIDQTMETSFSSSMGRKNMANAVHQLWISNRWTTERDIQRFLTKFSPDPNNGTPDQLLPAYLDGTASFDGSALDRIQKAVMVSYIVRNYSGHHLDISPILIARYSKILENMMHALLVAIESL